MLVKQQQNECDKIVYKETSIYFSIASQALLWPLRHQRTVYGEHLAPEPLIGRARPWSPGTLSCSSSSQTCHLLPGASVSTQVNTMIKMVVFENPPACTEAEALGRRQ